MSYPELCETCNQPYVDGAFSICSNPFHLCRWCKWEDGVLTKECFWCESARAKAVHNRAVDLITYISRKYQIDVASLYNEETRGYSSVKTLLEQVAKRRAEVGEWESH